MLFKEIHLKGIRSGEISLAFRRWVKAAVHKGSLLKTPIGLVEITEITPISEHEITAADALKAGFADVGEVTKTLRANPGGTVFRIGVCYHSPDPRIALREQTELSSELMTELAQKLERLDKFSKNGPWTKTVLEAIEANPNLHAVGIARLTGFEKEWLKLNIRKLKNLGLTISHTVGYELSPLGRKTVGAI